MNIVMTWVVGTFTIAVIILCWFITQPLLVQTTNTSDMIIDNFGANTTGWEATKTINLYVADLWPVPSILTTPLWIYISSRRTDPESVMYQ